MRQEPSDDVNSSWLGPFRLDLRGRESRACWLLFAAHFLILTFQYASKSVRQSIYIDSLGADKLPFVYLLVALCSYPLLKLYGRLVDRYPLRHLIAGSSLAVAASLMGFWWLFRVGAPGVSILFYLWIGIVGILLVSQFWTLSSQCLDPRQAKRLFGFIGAGGLLGGIAGGQLALWTSRLADTHTTLLVAAGVLVLAAALIGWRGKLATPERPRELPLDRRGEESSIEALGGVRDGLSVIRGSRYLQLIAAVMLLSAMVAQVIDLQFAWAIEQNTTELEQRTAAFGNLYSIMGVAAFFFQLLFTSRIHRRLGVGFALRVLPAANGIGSVFFVVAAFFFPTLLLPAVWMLKIGENGLRYSLDQASRELLFLPVPSRDRAKAKAFIDVFVQRAAKGLAAVALLSVTLGWVSVAQSAAFSLAWVLVWLALLGATRRHYVAAFRESLLHRDLEPDNELELEDAATLEVLVEGLGSADPREVLNSLELLSSHGRGRLVPPLMLHHPDSGVRCKTLAILQAEKRRDATPLIETVLGDRNPAVRVAATRALAALSPDDLGRLMSDHLEDADVRVRAAAVSYLAELDDPVLYLSADAAIEEMRQDGDADTRIEAARAIGEIDVEDLGGEIAQPLSGKTVPRRDYYQFQLMQLLYDSDPRVIGGAVTAVLQWIERGTDCTLYTATLVSHLRHRKLKHEARDALVAFSDPVIPALQHFMKDPQESIWVRRALPKTIARIGGRGALAALVESLDAEDPFLRRKVIEALLSLRTSERPLKPRRGVVASQIAQECRSYLVALIDLASLGGGTAVLRRPPSDGEPAPNRHSTSGRPLLERLLLDRMDDHRRNVFALLALIHSPPDIRAAYKSLESRLPRLQAHALEYLDNLLAGEVRRQVFAVIDDLPMSERLRHARRLFDLEPADTGVTLRKLASIHSNGDADAAWLAAAALQFIHDQRLVHLYPSIRRAARGENEPLVQETAVFLLSRIEAG